MKKTSQTLLIFLLLFAILLSCSAASAAGKKLKAGSTIIFGRYEQDADEENGPEEIEWTVLEVKKDKALVISTNVLAAVDYATEDLKPKESDWEHSNLRAWMNDTFLNAAFTEQEQKAILLTDVSNAADQGNKKWKMPASNDTQDRVFALSVKERNKYFKKDAKAMSLATAWAIRHGVKTDTYMTGGIETAAWWLRSPGDAWDSASAVSPTGVSYQGYNNCDLGARPAMWIDLNADVLN